MRYLIALCSFVFFMATLTAGVILSPQIGGHKTFVRIALNWPQEVNFEYNVDVGGVEIKFFEPAEILLDTLVKQFPGSSYSKKSDSTVLHVRYNGFRKVEVRSYGNIIYLDIYRNQTPPKNPADAFDKKSVPSPQKGKKAAAPDLDVQNPLFANLLKKVSSYLGVTTSDSVALVNDKDLLIKNLKAPIAVYKNEGVWNIVVQDKVNPSISEELQSKYDIKLLGIEGGYVLQISSSKIPEIEVSKTESGWLLKHTSFLKSKAVLVGFGVSPEGVLKAPRSGLMQPLVFDGVSVFCSLDASVMCPLSMKLVDGSIFSTRLGVAVKTAPKNIRLTDKEILLDNQGDLLSQIYTKRTINFPELEKRDFALQKQQFVRAVLDGGDKSYLAKITLAKFYLQKLFLEEAWDELASIEYNKIPSSILPELVILRFATIVMLNDPSNQGFKHIYNTEMATGLGQDVLAWYFLCSATCGISGVNQALISELVVSIQEWPENLRNILFLRIANVLHKQKNFSEFARVLRLIEPQSLLKVEFELYKYLFWQLQTFEDNAPAIDELKRLMDRVSSPILFARMVVETGVLDWSVELDIKYVDKLIYMLPLLEGHSIHIEAIKYLMKYFIHKQEFLNVLNMAYTIKQKYPQNYGSMVKGHVQNIISGIISTGQYKDLGLIQTLRILNSFAEVLPLNDEYVSFILDLTQKLNAIGMHDKSIDLIEKYLGKNKAGFSFSEQFVLVHFLLKMYLENNLEDKAQGALTMLKSREVFSEASQKKMQVLEAEIALKRGEVKKALTILNANSSFEALSLKADIFWKQKLWASFARNAEALLGLYFKDISDPADKEKHILHWVAALVLDSGFSQEAKVGNINKIKKIVDRYGQFVVKHKKLLEELAYSPNNSAIQSLGRNLVELELEEADRLESLFNSIKEVN